MKMEEETRRSTILDLNFTNTEKSIEEETGHSSLEFFLILKKRKAICISRYASGKFISMGLENK